MKIKKVGLIINPCAGIGGQAGLKGSDGEEVQRLAKEKGYHSKAPQRVEQALSMLDTMKEEIEIFTCPGEMGEFVAVGMGFLFQLCDNQNPSDTTAEDTKKAAKWMLSQNVDVLLFAGGDGTARDICEVVGTSLPAIGIPCGVKMHSAVYAVNPLRAGEALRHYLKGLQENSGLSKNGCSIPCLEREVMDIDEEQFRAGNIQAKLYGYLRVPVQESLIQKGKAGGYSQIEDLEQLGYTVAGRIKETDKNTLFIVGTGSTTASIMRALGLPYTLLGVDLVADGRLVLADASEKEIWDQMKRYEKTVIVVTVIGGQGHIFGRGNQQISSRIIRACKREDIWIVAGQQKLLDLLPAPLLVDTGDSELDKTLCGYWKIIKSVDETSVYRISC